MTLRLSWPAGATHVRISGDGGFASAHHVPVAATVAWTLPSGGSDGARKTVHVRFETGDGTPLGTHRDDVILDATAPRVRSARLARMRSARRYDVVLSAADRTSGVRQVQFAADRRRPAALAQFRARVRVRIDQRPRFVRVRDGAGNFSGWRALGAPRATVSKRR